MKYVARLALPLGCLILLAGCKGIAKVNVRVIDERTQLESQVLGSYDQLSADTAMIASVRGVDPEGAVRTPPPMSQGKERSLQAMQNREFNRDDIERLKQEGIVGENNDGLLTIFDPKLGGKSAKQQEFIRNLVTEENQDRTILMHRLIEVTPRLSEKDIPEVRKLMAKRNQENAKPGEQIQKPDGTWAAKAGKPEP